MKRLYIGSISRASGKDLLALGLALNLSPQGQRIGYKKPIGKEPVLYEEKLIDADALFFYNTIKPQQPLEITSPFIYTIESISLVLSGRLRKVKQKIKNSIKYFKDVDLLFIVGSTDIFEGSMFGINGSTLVNEMGLKAVMIERWHSEETIDTLLASRQILGNNLAGVIINRVKETDRGNLEKATKFLKRKGIKVFGILPEEPLLAAVPVRTVAEALGAKVFCAAANLDELVENISIGAMDVNNALRFFRATPNKAVITGTHRTDIQIAALETSTKCLILTGGLPPDESILAMAEQRGIPVLTVSEDTFHTVQKLESLFGKASIRDEKRLSHIKKLIKSHINISSLLRSL